MSYFDRDGQPMEILAFAAKYEDPDYRRVAYTEGTDWSVSTVWLGLNHNWGDGPPHIFETMAFGGEHDEDQWRWSTEAEAIAGHDQIVAMVRAAE